MNISCDLRLRIFSSQKQTFVYNKPPKSIRLFLCAGTFFMSVNFSYKYFFRKGRVDTILIADFDRVALHAMQGQCVYAREEKVNTNVGDKST